MNCDNCGNAVMAFAVRYVDDPIIFCSWTCFEDYRFNKV